MDKSNKRLLAETTTGLILALVLAGIIFFRLQETRKQVVETSKRADNARAGELAGQSQLLDINDGTKMIQSGLLAVESSRYGASSQADRALRHYLALAALPIAKVSHGDNVYAVYVAYSRNGQYVVSGGGKTVKVWEAQNGREVASMFTNSSVSSVAFSPDGRYVAAGSYSYDKTAQVWEVKSGKEVLSQSSDTGVAFVTFSPDGKYVAWGGGSAIRVWDIKKAREAIQIPHSSVHFIIFSPDGKYILSSSTDRTARVWDVRSGSEIIKLAHNGWVRKAIFSPDGKYIASISDERAARVWEVNSGREISEMYHDDTVNDIAFSPDGRYVISGSRDKTARVWEALNGHEVARMTHESSVSSVAFSPDGKYVVSGSSDGTARVWNTWDGHEFVRFEDAGINSAVFSPDGKYVVTGGCESLTYYQNGQPFICQGVARAWEVSNGRQVIDIPQRNSQYDYGNINSIMYSPLNNNYVLTGNSDGSARIWDIRSGREIIRVTPSEDRNSVSAIFSPNGQYILTSTWGNVARVWDALNGHEIAHMTHADQVLSIAFSPDSKYVVSGSSDGVAIVWEAKSGREVSRVVQNGYIKDAVFSPNGKYVATIDPGKILQTNVLPKEGTVRIWEVSNGREVVHITYPSQVDRIAFSTDSKYIALSGSTDPFKMNFKGIVSIREIPSGREVASYSHPYRIYSMIFTSVGKYLITGSADGYGTIVVWDMQAGKEAVRILSGDPLWGYSSLSLSPDNRYLLAGGYPARVWDLQSDRPQVEVRDELTDNLTFITHSRYLQSKNEISEFNFSDPGSSQFSPDGRYILTTGCDFNHYGVCNEKHVFILYWRVEDLAAEACRRLPRNFTLAEWVQYFPGEEYRATCPNLPIEP